MMKSDKMIALLLVILTTCSVQVQGERSCSVEFSISNSYTIASQQSSYVTLNLYAFTNGTEDIVAPYNLTIYNPSYVDAFSWNFEVTSVVNGVIYGETKAYNGFWQTLLAGSKNVFNLGGNIETTSLIAPPLLITIDGLVCELIEKSVTNTSGNTGQGSASSGTPGTSGSAASLGASSSAGSSSTSGSAGSSATPGSTGGSETSGSSGLAGSTTSGASATPRSTGTAGTSGSSGASGVSGSPGSTGTPESSGPPNIPVNQNGTGGFIPGIVTPSPPAQSGPPSPPPPPAPATPGRFPETNSTGQGKVAPQFPGANAPAPAPIPAPMPAPASSPSSNLPVLPV